MSYLKGKDLRHKGHTLECYLNMCPDYIIYRTKKIESIEAGDLGFTNGVIASKTYKPKGFEGW